MSDINISDATGLYTTSEVEQRTGVPATTLRQWERRYGIPHPVRNESGYRLYSAADLSRIDFLQARLSEGISISRAAQLCREHFGGAEQPEPPAPIPSDSNLQSELIGDLRRALLAPDHGRASDILSRALRHLTVEDVLMHIVQPALLDIGELWERGEITVAHEHQATSFLRGKIAGLLELAGNDGWGPSVVAACGPSEQHELGLLMLAVVLRRAGLRVHYLGPNTPLGDLAVYARQVQAGGVLISVQTVEALHALRAQLGDLRDLGMPLYFGGAAFNARPDLAAQLGGTYLGADAVQSAQNLVARLKERPHAP